MTAFRKFVHKYQKKSHGRKSRIFVQKMKNLNFLLFFLLICESVRDDILDNFEVRKGHILNVLVTIQSGRERKIHLTVEHCHFLVLRYLQFNFFSPHRHWILCVENITQCVDVALKNLNFSNTVVLNF